MIQIARMSKGGQREQALAQCCIALALAARDAELAAQASRLLSKNVPAWHFAIVREELRNAAYDAALRRAIRPGARVLEIGTGTGLLAMMAARAGAADLGRPMDILVSEIVSNNLLGEDVLPAHERAVRDLLKPGGCFIPRAGPFAWRWPKTCAMIARA